MNEADQINVIKLETIEYDATSHPSLKGSMDIIEQIQKGLGEDIILPDAKEDVVTNRMYSNVQPMYKAGCRGCDSPEYTANLCNDCWLHAALVDTTEFNKIVEGYRAQMYPDLPNNDLTNKDFVMKDITKRSRSDDDNNPEGGNPSKIAK